MRNAVDLMDGTDVGGGGAGAAPGPRGVPAPVLREVAQSWRDAEASYAPGSEHMEGITKIVEAGVGADLRAAGLSRTWTPRHADQLSRHPAGRGYNFSPGPGVLPTGAMAAAQKEFCDYAGTGMGVLEITNLDASNDHPGVAGVCAGQPHPVQVGAARPIARPFATTSTSSTSTSPSPSTSPTPRR